MEAKFGGALTSRQKCLLRDTGNTVPIFLNPILLVQSLFGSEIHYLPLRQGAQAGDQIRNSAKFRCKFEGRKELAKQGREVVVIKLGLELGLLFD